jgi:lipopolysaccharide/colanic/teichoic acid biosynthesis glycosyltransferase
MIKTGLDRLFALIALLVLSPIFIIISLIIWLFEQKPAFFLQNRVGTNKNEFTIYKFRTMADGKITFIGNVLRKTGIDELPQLLNILKGDMAFVGPRPLTMQDIVRLEWNTPYYNERWSISPGIVGLAQLAPACNKKMSWFYDKLYLEKKSFGLDVKIILAASLIPFVGKSYVKKWIHGKRKV